jgi:plastocyanin
VKRGLAVAIGAAALAVAPAAASTPKPLKVQVADDFFLPAKKTVKPGTKVVWKWLDYNGNTHDVKLKKGPKGVKKFQSEILSADVSYKKKLTVPGKYSIICSLHPDTMKLTITVKK